MAIGNNIENKSIGAEEDKSAKNKDRIKRDILQSLDQLKNRRAINNIPIKEAQAIVDKGEAQ